LHSPDQEFASIGANTQIPYAQRFAMFKQFLMENAHRDNIQNLFKWWNWHVFSFEMVPGTNRKEDDAFDSGMDEAEAALDSDDKFSDDGDEIFGNDIDNRRPDNLFIDFVPLTIAERISVAPLEPAVAPVYVNRDAIVAPWVREPTVVHSAGVALSHPSRLHNDYLTLDD
jgi:hypothetical protein